MVGSRSKSHRRLFVCQAALILLPVVVLALVGLSFLRQDKLLARREAEQRAQEIVGDILSRCLEALLTTNNLAVAPPHVLRLNSDGQLISPPPIPMAVPVLLDFSGLNPQQSAWWQ